MNFSVPTLAIGILIGFVAGALVASAMTSRYHITGKPSYFVRLDRLTGDLQSCSANECEPIAMKGEAAYAKAN